MNDLAWLFNFMWLALSLVLVVKSADFAIRYSTRIAQGLRLPKYIVGFLVIAVISILPETLVSITSAVEGVPAFALGALFGSNVADLSLIIGLVVIVSGRNLKVENRIIKRSYLYVGAMAAPILLGLNGHYSRLDGVLLIATGLTFYIYMLNQGRKDKRQSREPLRGYDIIMLFVSLAILLLASHLTVKFGVNFAAQIGVSPILIGMFVVALGTTLPEFTFALRAAKKHHDSLAIGDIIGTVVADATIVVGLIALIRPFAFSPRIMYISGMFMLAATIVFFRFIKTGHKISRREAIALVVLYLIFVVAELSLGHLFV